MQGENLPCPPLLLQLFLGSAVGAALVWYYMVVLNMVVEVVLSIQVGMFHLFHSLC